MGSLFAFFTSHTIGSSSSSSSSSSSNPNLGDLPEGCVALILTHLDPPQICKLATLSQAFRGASGANHRLLAKKLFDGSEENLGRKEIYERHPASMSAWLDKRSGGVCMSDSSKELAITGSLTSSSKEDELYLTDLCV